MVLPEKDGLLNGQHYEEIAERIYKDESPTSALIFFERQYSAVNVDFQKLLIKAIEGKIQAEYSTLNGLMLANPGTPLSEAKSWLPRLAGFKGIKEMVIEYFTPKGEYWEVTKRIIQKHRQMFPHYTLEELGTIFEKCEGYAQDIERLQAKGYSTEEIREEIGEELEELKAEGARALEWYYRYKPRLGRGQQTEIQLDEEGNERSVQKEVIPPFEGNYRWTRFKTTVCQDFLRYYLFPEVQECFFGKKCAAEFIQDVSELCPDCPIRVSVRERMEQKVIPVVEGKQRNSSASKFRQFLQKQIDKSDEAMEKYLSFGVKNEKESPDFLPNNIRGFLVEKETVKFLQSFFRLEAGEAQPFGEELEKVVRAVLEAYEKLPDGKGEKLLSSRGHFNGQKRQARALYNALKGEGYFGEATYQEKQFSDFLKKCFKFYISDSGLRLPEADGEKEVKKALVEILKNLQK